MIRACVCDRKPLQWNGADGNMIGQELNYTSRATKAMKRASQMSALAGESRTVPETLCVAVLESLGVAVVAVRRLGVKPRILSRQLRRQLGLEDNTIAGCPRRILRWMTARRKPPAEVAFSERIEQILAEARKEAVFMRHLYVGTEHILLGILICEPAIRECFAQAGVSREPLQRSIRETLFTPEHRLRREEP